MFMVVVWVERDSVCEIAGCAGLLITEYPEQYIGPMVPFESKRELRVNYFYELLF